MSALQALIFPKKYETLPITPNPSPAELDKFGARETSGQAVAADYLYGKKEDGRVITLAGAGAGARDYAYAIATKRETAAFHKYAISKKTAVVEQDLIFYRRAVFDEETRSAVVKNYVEYLINAKEYQEIGKYSFLARAVLNSSLNNKEAGKGSSIQKILDERGSAKAFPAQVKAKSETPSGISVDSASRTPTPTTPKMTTRTLKTITDTEKDQAPTTPKMTTRSLGSLTTFTDTEKVQAPTTPKMTTRSLGSLTTFTDEEIAEAVKKFRIED